MWSYGRHSLVAHVFKISPTASHAGRSHTLKHNRCLKHYETKRSSGDNICNRTDVSKEP